MTTTTYLIIVVLILIPLIVKLTLDLNYYMLFLGKDRDVLNKRNEQEKKYLLIKGLY